MDSELLESELLARIQNLGIQVDPLEALSALLKLDVLVPVNTEEDADDRSWTEQWHWGAIGGLFHYATRDVPWVDESRQDAVLREIAKEQDVPLWFTATEGAVDLPQPRELDFLRLAAARQTRRDFEPSIIELSALGDCLYAGLGIRGYLEGLPHRPTLPLKMTPSPGARNPFEGYVLVRSVSGLEAGVYRYVGSEHALEPVSAPDLPAFSNVFGEQRWTDDAAAAIVLVAYLERPMHKYRLPSAYASVLIEAGHIAQNVVLCATRLGLASATSAALNHTLLERSLGQNDPLHASLYAVLLGAERET